MNLTLNRRLGLIATEQHKKNIYVNKQSSLVNIPSKVLLFRWRTQGAKSKATKTFAQERKICPRWLPLSFPYLPV